CRYAVHRNQHSTVSMILCSTVQEKSNIFNLAASANLKIKHLVIVCCSWSFGHELIHYTS
ncbi:hypothetical protein M514_15215, partial [Trichuris suis]